MKEKKKAVLNKYLEVNGIQDVAEYCLKFGIKQIIKKNDFFITENQICNKVGYIKTGGFRYIKTNSSNVEYIVSYTFAEDFVTDYPALQTGILTNFTAQAITDSEIYVITKNQLDEFYNKPSNKHLRAKIAEAFLADIYARLLTMHCLGPEERYLKLINRYPDILNQVPLKEIASFIKITPETLSRIRKKIVSE